MQENLGESTSNLTEQVTWIDSVVLSALKNADRPVNLIYRAALDNKAPTTVRQSIEGFVTEILNRGGKIKVWVQLKFNWSHGHSTPILVHAHGGGTGDGYWTPPSNSYKMAWMIRNEDFFFLRWPAPSSSGSILRATAGRSSAATSPGRRPTSRPSISKRVISRFAALPSR